MSTRKKFVAAALAVTANMGMVAGNPANAGSLESGGSTTSSTVQSVDEQLQKQVFAKCESGDLQGAMSMVEQAIAANPKCAVAYMCKAMILYYRHDGVSEVIEALNKAVAVDPKMKDALKTRGYLYESLNDYVSALKDFDAVLALDPRDAKALQQRITMHRVLRDAKGLVADFTLKISIDPNDASAYYNRGMAFEQAGDKEKAIADLQKAESMFVAQGEIEGAKAARDEIAGIQKTA